MSKLIYVDNAGTTAMSKHAKSAMLKFLDNEYGNASSLHSLGQRAKEYLTKAREMVAKAINALPDEIYFTSGGSESDNMAILSTAHRGKAKGKMHIITSSIEHHAVLHTLDRLKEEGFEVTYLPVYKDGLIKIADLKKAITDQTCLVTIMYANNEIGTIQPIEKIGKICRDAGVPFFTDAVQAVGHIPVDVKADNIDMLSLSGHKFHGPKGVGALYVRRGVMVDPLISGGTQEKNRRAGTENVAGIYSMAVALEDAVKNMEKNAKAEIKLRDYLIENLSKIPHSKLNGNKEHRLPNNFNMCFEGIEGESLLLLLDDYGICASSGSACTSGSLDPSHVLLAIGLPHEVAHGSLRITVSPYNTMAEMQKICKYVPQIVEYLRKISPIWDRLQKGELKHVI